MLIIPKDQAAPGDGNSVKTGVKVKTSEIMPAVKSLHFVYSNADGSLYTGDNAATIKVYASNEYIKEAASEAKAWVLLVTIVLDKDTPAKIYDVIGTYNNIKGVVSDITDGKVSVFYGGGR